jgi:hypothetical protein
VEGRNKSKSKMQNYNPKSKNSDNRPVWAKKAEDCSVLGEYYLKKQRQTPAFSWKS